MLTTPYGVPLYRWDPAEGAVRRSEEEVAADVAALPAPGAAITAEQERDALLLDHDYRLTLLEHGMGDLVGGGEAK